MNYITSEYEIIYGQMNIIFTLTNIDSIPKDKKNKCNIEMTPTENKNKNGYKCILLAFKNGPLPSRALFFTNK